MSKVTADTVRDDFNDPVSVVHYARAAHFLGLWESERILVERFFPDKNASLLEAGCGAGRATIGLWHLGYQRLTAFDFASEPLAQAQSLAAERGAAIVFHLADATTLESSPIQPFAGIRAGALPRFDGVLFLFNGLMQIPGRDNRRAALKGLRAMVRPGAPFLFTSHDRDYSPLEKALWRSETARWSAGQQDERLVEFGDRYFSDESGNTFMHLPTRAEVLEDLEAAGWRYTFDALRRDVAKENRPVLDFSDECRFWLAEAP